MPSTVRLLFACLWLAVNAAASEKVIKEHAIALLDKPLYPEGFTHFRYSNPSAPKGGELSIAATIRFDSFNPYILKGTSAYNSELLYDSLLAYSADEPYSAYGLIAESIERASDDSWVAFNLRPEARFHDGDPITAEDVVFSFYLLVEKGEPEYRLKYEQVSKAEATSKYRALFTFARPRQKKLPFLLGELPVFPKHYWTAANRDFSKANLTIPLGSGPYKIRTVKPGRQVIWERVNDYWAKDLPINRGRHNFDSLRDDYFLGYDAALEAFRAGQVNFNEEGIARNWHSAYDFPAITQGKVIKERIPVKTHFGMSGFMFNTRRVPLDNRGIRQALTLLYDFEWINKHLMYGEYERIDSYFVNTSLAARGLPSAPEVALLTPFKHQLFPEVMTRTFQLPVTDGTGNLRPQIKKALSLFGQNGWHLKNNRMTNDLTGKPMELTLITSFPLMVKVLVPYQKRLEETGIKLTIEALDGSDL